MKTYIAISLMILVSYAAADEYQLEKLWETEQVLKIPESILYNPIDSLLYISNINGSPTGVDSNGFISKVALDGAIEELKWVDGLNAPKGSGIFGGRLFVTDIDHLVEIDLKSGKILNRHPAPGAKFLNDVAIDTAGNVYVTDYSQDHSAIYTLSKGKIEIWARGKEIKSPNGLWMGDQELFFGNTGDGSLKAINLATKKIRTIATVGFGIDGLRADGRGNWIVSDWSGKTSLVDTSSNVHILLDTTKQKINSADIEYIQSMNMLIIPTFFDNRAVGYRLVPDNKNK